MKQITKITIFTLLFMLATTSFAQQFGIKAGLNLSNQLIKNYEKSFSDENKLKPGFHAGLVAQFPISGIFSFEPGLMLSTKGYKQYVDDAEISELRNLKHKLTLYYLELPINLRADFGSGDIKFYALFGPYAGLGLAGKMKTTYNFHGNDEKSESDIKWGTNAEEDDLKRFDFGLNAGAGVNLGTVDIGAGYTLGLANISPGTEGGFMRKNRVISVSIGYKFGGK